MKTITSKNYIGTWVACLTLTRMRASSLYIIYLTRPKRVKSYFTCINWRMDVSLHKMEIGGYGSHSRAVNFCRTTTAELIIPGFQSDVSLLIPCSFFYNKVLKIFWSWCNTIKYFGHSSVSKILSVSPSTLSVFYNTGSNLQ